MSIYDVVSAQTNPYLGDLSSRAASEEAKSGAQEWRSDKMGEYKAEVKRRQDRAAKKAREKQKKYKTLGKVFDVASLLLPPGMGTGMKALIKGAGKGALAYGQAKETKKALKGMGQMGCFKGTFMEDYAKGYDESMRKTMESLDPQQAGLMGLGGSLMSAGIGDKLGDLAKGVGKDITENMFSGLGEKAGEKLSEVTEEQIEKGAKGTFKDFFRFKPERKLDPTGQFADEFKSQLSEDIKPGFEALEQSGIDMKNIKPGTFSHDEIAGRSWATDMEGNTVEFGEGITPESFQAYQQYLGMKDMGERAPLSMMREDKWYGDEGFKGHLKNVFAPWSSDDGGEGFIDALTSGELGSEAMGIYGPLIEQGIFGIKPTDMAVQTPGQIRQQMSPFGNPNWEARLPRP